MQSGMTRSDSASYSARAYGAWYRGAAWGLLTFAATTAVAWLAHLLLPAALLGRSAAADTLAIPSVAMRWAMAAGFAPLFETLVGQWLPLELLRRAGAGQRTGVAACAAVFGLGHYLNGGLAHGLVTAVGGALFALAYLHSRAISAGRAYLAAALAHAVNNACALTVLALWPDL